MKKKNCSAEEKIPKKVERAARHAPSVKQLQTFWKHLNRVARVDGGWASRSLSRGYLSTVSRGWRSLCPSRAEGRVAKQKSVASFTRMEPRKSSLQWGEGERERREGEVNAFHPPWREESVDLGENSFFFPYKVSEYRDIARSTSAFCPLANLAQRPSGPKFSKTVPATRAFLPRLFTFTRWTRGHNGGIPRRAACKWFTLELRSLLVFARVINA